MMIHVEQTYLEVSNGRLSLTQHALITLTKAWLEDRGYHIWDDDDVDDIVCGDLAASHDEQRSVFIVFVTDESRGFKRWVDLLSDERLHLAVACALMLPIRYTVIVWRRHEISGKLQPVVHSLTYADFADSNSWEA
jgi:hypothetical protein